MLGEHDDPQPRIPEGTNGATDKRRVHALLPTQDYSRRPAVVERPKLAGIVCGGRAKQHTAAQRSGAECDGEANDRALVLGHRTNSGRLREYNESDSM
jgi:hypothetical protein